jgi:hypothetical protein
VALITCSVGRLSAAGQTPRVRGNIIRRRCSENPKKKLG